MHQTWLNAQTDKAEKEVARDNGLTWCVLDGGDMTGTTTWLAQTDKAETDKAEKKDEWRQKAKKGKLVGLHSKAVALGLTWRCKEPQQWGYGTVYNKEGSRVTMITIQHQAHAHAQAN